MAGTRPAGAAAHARLRSAAVCAAGPRGAFAGLGGSRGRRPRRPGAITNRPTVEEVERVDQSEGSAGSRDPSYSELYDRVFSQEGGPPRMNRVLPKPSPEAQAQEEGSKKILLSDVFATVKRNAIFGRKFSGRDIGVMALVTSMHLGCLLAPFTFSWANLALCMGLYFVTGCIGITFGYHRCLSHRSFALPKAIEYFAAYCGVLTIQGEPVEWASTHRYHHMHCDTPLDPHSAYEGTWWSHAGWFLDNEITLDRTSDHSNVKDLLSQPFYRWMRKTYPFHIAAQFVVLYALGGLPALVWGGCLRTCIVWHITWSINSFCHIYGSQDFDTKDLSKNNWLFGLLAWGEGWHNNHHAFEFSARHGLKPWQFDLTWMIIRGLQMVGLAKKVKLPSEDQMRRLSFQ